MMEVFNMNSTGKMKMMVVVAVGLATLPWGGCAGVAGGVAIDAAVPAIDKTSEFVNAGKCQAYEPVPMEDVVPIVHQAAEQLELTYVSEEKSGDKLKLVYKDTRQ